MYININIMSETEYLNHAVRYAEQYFGKQAITNTIPWIVEKVLEKGDRHIFLLTNEDGTYKSTVIVNNLFASVANMDLLEVKEYIGGDTIELFKASLYTEVWTDSNVTH